jgi:hypothetical protein
MRVIVLFEPWNDVDKVKYGSCIVCISGANRVRERLQ